MQQNRSGKKNKELSANPDTPMEKGSRVDIKNYINGEFVESSKKDYIDIYNPSTGAVYARSPKSSPEDIEQAVWAAKQTNKSWRLTSEKERNLWLEKIANAIQDNLEELAYSESQDQGKPLWLARTVDIPRAVDNFRFFAGAILHQTHSSTHPETGVLNYSKRQPTGVCGLISPWNLPLYLLTWKIAPAIAMGNAVVCKPSELTPLTAFKLSQLLAKIQLPPGLVNIVYGLGQEAGAALVKHPDVPAISFTGSTQTGELIAKDAAPYQKKLSLELGGKNPNIICEDANLEKAVSTSIRSSFLNQGEICLCGSRILVHESIYEGFVSKFVDKTRLLKTGNPNQEEHFIGALVSKEHQEKVLSYCQKSLALGGKILCGGKPPRNLASEYKHGYYVEPTVIIGLDPGCSVMQEEIFGPVVTITPFSDLNQAISLANGVSYGLSATIWTQSLEKAHYIADSLEAGQIWVNTWMKRDLRTPFGGMKASGVGREGGVHSLEFYSEEKNICIDYNL